MIETLSKEDKERFLNEVSGLKKILKQILQFYKKNLSLFNGLQTKNYTAYLLNIIARFRYNCESLEHLMDPFASDFRLTDKELFAWEDAFRKISKIMLKAY